MQTKKYVLDTNIINWLIDGKIEKSAMPGDGEFVATPIQIDEINRTSDEERRGRLFLTLASSLSGLLQTETTAFGKRVIYTSIKNQLDGMNRGKASNSRDALIAEVTIAGSHTLLTADRDLAKVTGDHGGMVRLFTI